MTECVGLAGIRNELKEWHGRVRLVPFTRSLPQGRYVSQVRPIPEILFVEISISAGIDSLLETRKASLSSHTHSIREHRHIVGSH